jgi:membrane-associated phospholipid phosphatase
MTGRDTSLRRLLVASVFFCSLSTSYVLHGQEISPAGALLQPTASGQTASAQAPAAPAAGRDVSWHQLPGNFLHDQKDLWLFPLQLAHGRHWVPASAIIVVTAGLLAADPHDAPYFRRTANFQGFNRAFSGRATGLEIALVPASFYAVGLARRDSYAQKTALFAGEAVANSLVLYSVMNAASRRLRPSDIAPAGDFSDTFFSSHTRVVGSSFPSGHTVAAFAVATVFARRYRNHRWVPWVAYGAAGVIGFSRITLQSHFPADVFVAAALGYSISRFDVLRAR